MRTQLEIIQELKHVTYWSQPNIKHDEMMALLNELEATLNPTEPTVEVIPEMIEEMIAEAVEVAEEPVAEKLAVVPVKKTTKK